MLFRFLLNAARVPKELIPEGKRVMPSFAKAGFIGTAVIAGIAPVFAYAIIAAANALEVSLLGTPFYASLWGIIVITHIVRALIDVKIANKWGDGKNLDLNGDGDLTSKLKDFGVDLIDTFIMVIPSLLLFGNFLLGLTAVAVVSIIRPVIQYMLSIYAVLDAFDLKTATLIDDVTKPPVDNSVESYNSVDDVYAVNNKEYTLPTHTLHNPISITGLTDEVIARMTVESALIDMAESTVVEAGSLIQIANSRTVSDFVSVKYNDGTIRRFFNPESSNFVVIFTKAAETGICVDTDLKTVATITRDDFQQKVDLIFPSLTIEDVVQRKGYFRDGVLYRNY